MIPLRDDNPTRHTCLVTYFIIGCNVAVWIWIQRLGLQPYMLNSILKHGLIPAELLGRLPPGTRIPVGPDLVYTIGSPNWISPVTSMFLHGGWFHLIGNMWFLAIFGDNVEDAMGGFRFIVFYLACGLLAAVAQVAANPASPIPMIGASGAIGGVMAAYVVLYPRAPIHLLVFLGFFVTRVILPAFLVLVYWFIIQLVGALSTPAAGGGVAFWAHVGGFVAGLILVYAFCQPERLRRCRLRKR